MLSGVGRARGPPLPFAFYPEWQQQVTKNDHEARIRNRAKYGGCALDSPERVLWPKQPSHQGKQPQPLPRSGSVQPQRGADGGQPFRPVTIRAPVAAGPRRSRWSFGKSVSRGAVDCLNEREEKYASIASAQPYGFYVHRGVGGHRHHRDSGSPSTAITF